MSEEWEDAVRIAKEEAAARAQARKAEPLQARSTDPDTSRAAAKRIKPDAGLIQSQVLSVLLEAYPGGLSDTQMIEIANRRFGERSDSTWRTRRSELVNMGRVGWCGKRVNEKGSTERVWIYLPANERP